MTNCRSLCQYDKLTRDKMSQPLEAWSLRLGAFRPDQCFERNHTSYLTWACPTYPR